MWRLSASAQRGWPRAGAPPTLAAHLRPLWQECTAGNPRRAGGLWTHLSWRAWSRRLLALGPPARRRTIRRRLSTRNRGRRPARKQKTRGHHPARHAPCDTITHLRRAYEAAGAAVLSIDTKKTAWRGHVHRAGTPCTAATVATFDHEFGAASEGTRMPHGVYDVVHQHAPIHRKASHDPSAWRCDRGALWWEHAGRAAPPPATRLWVRGDGGGSTSATPSLVQEDLPGLAHRLGLARRVAHSPP
jgi:Rhodopirellula transposase DDE domain